MTHDAPLRMLAGLGAGLALGLLAHAFAGDAAWLHSLLTNVLDPAGRIFLGLFFMLMIPLIASSLAIAVSEFGDVRSLGRVGARTFAYTLVVSSIAVAIGVGLVNALQPGADLQGLKALVRDTGIQPAQQASGIDFVVNLVPRNVMRSMADGDMLAVMVFALFLGLGIAITRTSAARQFEGALRGVYDVVMNLMGLVLRLAPYGVACLVFSIAARLGTEALQLWRYVAIVVFALALHQFGVYSLSVWLLGGMSPARFFRAVRTPMLTAFSTASSAATLPVALIAADEELRLPSHVSRFVLTLGSTANQNGTALFEGVTVLFLAQIYEVPLPLAQQVMVVFICILGGIGTAGVPAGSLPVIVMILGLIGIPADAIGIVFGVDRFLDMCRTTVNVTGDLAAAVVVARGDPALPGVEDATAS
jgi:dicarboxylate/amino acid:cation (Na+ or H+) symporter, DAACS family